MKRRCSAAPGLCENWPHPPPAPMPCRCRRGAAASWRLPCSRRPPLCSPWCSSCFWRSRLALSWCAGVPALQAAMLRLLPCRCLLPGMLQRSQAFERVRLTENLAAIRRWCTSPTPSSFGAAGMAWVRRGARCVLQQLPGTGCQATPLRVSCPPMLDGLSRRARPLVVQPMRCRRL